MLTNNKIKLIKSLNQKKVRRELGLFLVEGEKMVKELLESQFETEEVFALQQYIDELNYNGNIEITAVNQKDLERISMLKTPNKVVAIAKIPQIGDAAKINNGLSIALENVQDPGNLGTIVRTAAWFGIKNVYCSPETVDIYNPKVIQSTMGAIFKVNVQYCDLALLAEKAKKVGVALYGTRLDGRNIYNADLKKDAIIFMGNESKGLSAALSQMMSENLKIPTYANAENDMESLNVSIATAIVCAEFRRRNS